MRSRLALNEKKRVADLGLLLPRLEQQLYQRLLRAGHPANLNLIWFAVPTGTPPPASGYIKLIDRETGIEYQSNTVTVLFP